MAEGKKSFVLYVDQKTTIDQLPDEVAGKLLKHIYAYCNDENPVTDDLLLNIAFEPIKQTFKRDLKRYKERADRSRVNGTKGGRPKKPKKPSGLIQNPDEPRKPDSVSVSVSDRINNRESNKAEFLNSLKKYTSVYSKDMLNDFYFYWTEHGEKDYKLRFEKEKSFSIERRLSRWNSNQSNFKPKQQRL